MLYDIVAIAELLENLTAAMIGIWAFRFLNRPFKLVLAIGILAFFTELAGYLLGKLHLPAGLYFNAFMIVEKCLFVAAALYYIPKKFRVLYTAIFILFLCSGIWLILNGGIWAVSGRSYALLCLMEVIIYMHVLWLQAASREKMIANPVVWLCLALLIYNCCCLPYFGLYSYLSMNRPTVWKALNYIVNVANLIYWPIISLCFFRVHKRGRLPSSAVNYAHG